ncbi:unnamed protein product [Rhizoctonia solani]|uniref:Uncharacterized protein n=1 Tax=Rhizoctonia solani TaxID=456999 RepID=A0A8H3DXV7_9AGAM|nr:unnamed protein product [Rhizoctonia solani]
MSLFNMLGPFSSPSTHPGSGPHEAGNVAVQTVRQETAYRSRTLSPSIFNLVNPEPAQAHSSLLSNATPPQATTLPRPIRPRPRMRPPPADFFPPASSNPPVPPPPALALASPFHQPAGWFQFPSTPTRTGPIGPGLDNYHPIAPLSLPNSPLPLRHHYPAPLIDFVAPLPPQEVVPIAPPTMRAGPPINPGPHSARKATDIIPSTPKARLGSPASTLILTDTESTPATPILAPKAKSVPKTSKSLRRQPGLSEVEFDKLLSGGPGSRTGKSYTLDEDLAIATYLADPQYPERRIQAEQKTPKGIVPQVYSQMSKAVFKQSRDPGALQVRYMTVLRAKFRLIEKLENATGGNGDADYAIDDPEQAILEKLGIRLDRAAQRNKGQNMTAAEYYAWIKDPQDGLYAKLSDLLSRNVSVIRKTQFRSGIVSPDSKPSAIAGLDDPNNDIIDLDPDQPTPDSRKSKANQGKVTPAAGLAFLDEARAYHSSRAETEKDRLALEHRRFEIELANEARMEQRLKLEQERVAIMRSEQVHAKEIATKAHELEVERLALAREREFDRKRKTDIDELDRERTHKRHHREAATTTAVQISGDKDDRFTKELRDASQAHIMLMFEQVRDLLD